MAGNDDIQYLLENRQLLLVSVEPFPAMDETFTIKTAGTAYLVSIQSAIDIQRGRYAELGLERVSEMTDRDLLLDYMANNWASTFFIDGRAILEPELVTQRKQEEIPGKLWLCVILAALLILTLFTFKHALMFAEASNNQ